MNAMTFTLAKMNTGKQIKGASREVLNQMWDAVQGGLEALPLITRCNPEQAEQRGTLLAQRAALLEQCPLLVRR